MGVARFGLKPLRETSTYHLEGDAGKNSFARGVTETQRLGFNNWRENEKRYRSATA